MTFYLFIYFLLFIQPEFTLDGYQKHKRHKEAEAPLTEREKELAEVKTAEVKI